MKKIKIGVIAAAGKGTRAYPKTSFLPKPLFQIEGKTILQRNIELMVKTFSIEKVYILVGHLKEQVIEEVEKIRNTGIKVGLETCLWTTKGLAADIASLESRIDSPFLTILGDEFYLHTNHEAFLQTYKEHPELSASIGVQKTNLLSRIRKNYSVELKKDRIVDLVEKPENPPNEILGLGSYLFTPEYFSFFHKTPPSPKSGVIEITDVIDKMAKESPGGVFATHLKCVYFNINSMQDYHHAVYEVRNDSFQQFKVSLVVPTFNNERSVTDVIEDFRKKVSEIVVVDNESTDDTVSLAKKEKVRVVEFSGNGGSTRLGDQIKRGIQEATGDIIIITSADGAYRSKDFPKLLEYLKDSDMVIGTRTTRQMIEQGSNLKPLNRIVSLIMGKLIEVFWWGQEPRFTDIKCQFLGIWKESFLKILDNLNETDDNLIPEMMIEITRAHMRCIEIPVSYFKPVHVDKTTFFQLMGKAWKIFVLILRKKFQK